MQEAIFAFCCLAILLGAISSDAFATVNPNVHYTYSNDAYSAQLISEYAALTYSYSFDASLTNTCGVRYAEQIDNAVTDWKESVLAQFDKVNYGAKARFLMINGTTGLYMNIHAYCYFFDSNGSVVSDNISALNPCPEPTSDYATVCIYMNQYTMDGCYSAAGVQSICAHELGHFFGLAHLPTEYYSSVPSIMQASAYFSPYQVVQDDDIHQANSLYLHW